MAATPERTAALIQKLIERTLKEFPGMTREEVLEIIRDFRPEAAKVFHLLPQPQEAVLKIDESR